MSRPGRKRLGVDLPEGIHRYIKDCAKKHNCSLTKYVIRVLVGQIKQEKGYDK